MRVSHEGRAWCSGQTWQAFVYKTQNFRKELKDRKELAEGFEDRYRCIKEESRRKTQAEKAIYGAFNVFHELNERKNYTLETTRCFHISGC